MTKLVVISGKKFCRLLDMLGFVRIHQRGSHIRYKHPDGRLTVVPVHGDEELGRGLLCEMLRQIKLSKKEYDSLRKKL